MFLVSDLSPGFDELIVSIDSYNFSPLRSYRAQYQFRSLRMIDPIILE